MAEDLATPAGAHQVIMVKNPSVCLQCTTGSEVDSIGFIGGAHQLSQVSILCGRSNLFQDNPFVVPSHPFGAWLNKIYGFRFLIKKSVIEL